MPTNTTYFSAVTRNIRNKHVFRVHLIFGGAKTALLRQLSLDPQALVVLIDNQHELEKIRKQYPDLRFRTLALGQGQTTRSMSALRLTGNSTSHGGFGARLKYAEVAAKDLLDSTDFHDFNRSIPTEGLVRCGGRLDLVEVYVYGSIAGAGCSGASTVVTRALLPAVLRLGCPVELTFSILGATTYEGIAERGRPNAASALVSQIRLMLDQSPQLDMVATYIDLHELPPFQDDFNRRNRYLLFDAIAQHSIETEDYKRLIRPNRSSSGACGNLTSRQVDFMTGLDAERDIASRVAINLSLHLEEQLGLAQADPQLVDEIRWQDGSEEQARESVDEVLKDVHETSTDQLLRAICKPPAVHRFEIFAVAAHGGEFLLEHLESDFSVTPKRVDDFMQRITLLRTFDNTVASELDWVRAELGVLGTSIKAIEAAFVSRHRQLVKGKYLRRSTVEKQLKALADELRLRSDHRALRNAELDALVRANVAVQKELSHHVAAIQTLIREIDKYVPRGSLQKPSQFVLPFELSDVFESLLPFPSQQRLQQIQTLCAAAGAVSAAGLAAIVHSPSDRLEAIAHAIVYGEYDVDGPPHGGRERQHVGKTIYVLPPLDGCSRELLPSLILRENPEAKILFADTLQFGATVVRMQFHTFADVDEVFRGLPGTDLYEAYTDELAELNSPDEFASLMQLGGHIEGNRIVFSPSTPNTK